MSDEQPLYNQDDPLARLPDEPIKAHLALIDYEAMGPTRSFDQLEKVYRSRTEAVPTRQASRLKEWSSAFHWQERVATAHDIRSAKERAEREAIWTARREQLREQSWSLAERLRARAEQLLEFPIAEVTIETSRQTSDDGTKITIINQVFKPARWSQRDITTITETYDKVARLAAGMDTDQQRIVIDGLTPEDLENLPDEELDRLEQELTKKTKNAR